MSDSLNLKFLEFQSELFESEHTNMNLKFKTLSRKCTDFVLMQRIRIQSTCRPYTGVTRKSRAYVCGSGE
jgi:hypothetical protein